MHRSVPERQVMTEAQFLDWAALQDAHYELVDGFVMMQAGATRDHERVAKRVFAALLRQVDEAQWDVNKGDFGVRIRSGHGAGSILYPDVVVDLQSSDGHERATTTPIAVIEVLSPSTDLAHHVEKFERYRLRETLSIYAIIDQKRPTVHVWVRNDGRWPEEATVIEGLDKCLELTEIGAVLDLREIYRLVGT